MGWKSFFIGMVVLVLGASAGADPRDTREVSEVALSDVHAEQQAAAPSPLRPAEGQPRYATMTPPPSEEMPSAAPTQRVGVAPIPAQNEAAPQPVRANYASREPAAPQYAGLRPSEDSLYRLGAGDKLRLTIFNETDLSGEFAIDGQGYLRLPLVGQVAAAGQTSFGLEARIADAFVRGGFLLNPKVAVEIVSYRPFYIIGEVAKPGEYAYVNAMSVPNAIALAGGYTDRAVTGTIWVRREGGPKEHEFRADETTKIMPGDVVRVERSSYWSLMTLLAPLISPFATTAYMLK